MTLPICVRGITEWAGKETEDLDWNLLMPIVWTVLYKHTAAGCPFLLPMQLTGIIWYNLWPIFPKPLLPLLHDFGGKYSISSFKEILEMRILRKKKFFFLHQLPDF